jgi:MscS family membrane protein
MIIKNKRITILFYILFISISFVQNNIANELDANVPANSENEIIEFARLTSPRATWISLCTLSKKYNDIIRVEGFTTENKELLHVLEEQISTCYNLCDISPSTQIDIAMETTIYLCEMMARFPPVDPTTLPDRKEAFKEIQDGFPAIWHIDKLPVAIIQRKDGDFAGEFQISRHTISIASQAYEHFKSLPYYDSKPHDYVENYFLTPGPSLSTSFIRSLPPWMQIQYKHNTLWQWITTIIGLPLLFLLLFFINKLIRSLCKKREKTTTALLRLLFPIISIILTIGVCSFLNHQVFATGSLLTIIKFIEYLTILAASVLLIERSSRFTSVLIEKKNEGKEGINSTLVHVGLRLFSMTLSTIVILEGLQKMGFSLATVLAGAGVTGLAIALAAQESLRNIFGSLMLLLDKPFIVGQRINLKGHDGVVEAIGIRSTKIRLLSGHLTSIPNDEVARVDIENIGARQYIRKKFDISITYDTPPAKITEARNILHNIFAIDENDQAKTEKNKHVNVEEFLPKIFFTDLCSDSLNIMVIIYYHPAVTWDFYAYVDLMNQEIIERFNEAGINFAFPSQTIYIAGDDDKKPRANPFQISISENKPDELQEFNPEQTDIVDPDVKPMDEEVLKKLERQ